MSSQHKDLAGGRWSRMPLVEQMANIGSEVERALIWKTKNSEYSKKAFERALELVDLSLESQKKSTIIRELARVREAMVDYFYGTNDSLSTQDSWRKYFLPFVYASRKSF